MITKVFPLSADINKRAEGPLILSVPAGQSARRHSALFFRLCAEAIYRTDIFDSGLTSSNTQALDDTKKKDNKIASWLNCQGGYLSHSRIS